MNLEEEFAIYGRDRAQAFLKKKGCPEDAAAWAASADALLNGIRWTPTLDAGLPVIVLPVTDGPIVDLVAWEPYKPGQWYLRRGVDCVLGWYDLRQAQVYRTPLVIHETPIDWMMSGMIGCVPLTWDAGKHFMGVQEIKASDKMFKSIIDSMEEMYPRPRKIA